MTFALGILVGLLLPPAWRLLRDVRHARHSAYLAITQERRAMLVRDGAL